ncbi:hypothetical protein A2U01_0093369, partial [Trifolium medium]|nr:hypothetical protein [Trifolium medium]
DLKQCLWDVSL